MPTSLIRVRSFAERNVVVVLAPIERANYDQRLLLVVPATNTITSFFPPWTLLIITDLGSLCDGSSPISGLSPVRNRSNPNTTSHRRLIVPRLRNLYQQPPLLDDSRSSIPRLSPLCNSAAIVSYHVEISVRVLRIESRVPSNSNENTGFFGRRGRGGGRVRKPRGGLPRTARRSRRKKRPCIRNASCTSRYCSFGKRAKPTLLFSPILCISLKQTHTHTYTLRTIFAFHPSSILFFRTP